MSNEYDGGAAYDAGFTYDAVELIHRMTVRVALNTSKLAGPEFVSKMQVGIDGLTANVAIFTSPTPTLLVAQGANDALAANLQQILATVQLLTQLREQREQLRTAAEATYAQLASYVENKAAGDASKILLAGFDVAAAPTAAPLVEMPKVQGNRLVSGPDEGKAEGEWDLLTGARSYEVQIALSGDNGPWTHYQTTTEPSVVLAGQTSGQKRWTRVRAVNKLGPGPWSDPACAMIP